MGPIIIVLIIVSIIVDNDRDEDRDQAGSAPPLTRARAAMQSRAANEKDSSTEETPVILEVMARVFTRFRERVAGYLDPSSAPAHASIAKSLSGGSCRPSQAGIYAMSTLSMKRTAAQRLT